jgi:hypothetical protein
LLPKDFEQSGKRVQPTAKPKLNSRSNNGPPKNAGNRKAAARKRMKAARYTCSLPDPPTFGREKAVNEEHSRKELKQAEMAFLEELALSAILDSNA